MGGRALRAGKAFIEMALKDTGVQKGLMKIERRFDAIGGSLTRFGQMGTAVGGSILATFGGMVTSFAKAGDQIDKLSQRTGFTAESLSQLKFAAEQSGGSIEQLEKLLTGMTRTVRGAEQGLATQTDALADLGISYEDLRDLAPETQFALMAQRISEVEDPTRRAGIALQIFGRAGQNMLPMLNLGEEGIRALMQEADSLGATISGEAATSAAEFTDALNRLWTQLKAASQAVGAQLAPALTHLLSLTPGVIKSVIDWIKENRELVIGVAAAAAGLVALGTGTIAAGLAFNLLSTAVGITSTILGGIAAILGAPVLAIAAVVAAVAALVDWFLLGGAVTKFFGGIMKSIFGSLASYIAKTLGGIFEWLGKFSSELLGIEQLNAELEETAKIADTIGGTIEVGAAKGPAGGPATELQKISQQEEADANRRAEQVQASLDQVAASIDAQSSVTQQAADFATSKAQGELGILSSIDTNMAAARELLRRIEAAQSQGASFA